MSHSFAITPKKRLLRQHLTLTVEQALAVGEPGLRPYNVDPDQMSQFLSASLGDVLARLGIAGRSGRGFELSFEDGSYRVREYTPATPEDWRIALRFVSALAAHVEGTITGEDDRTYTPATVLEWDWAADALFGIQSMRPREGEKNGAIMPGLVRPVTFSASTFEEILAAPSPVDAFGQWFTAVQNEEAFDANQKIVQTPEGEIRGLYVLGEGVTTVLPWEPVLDLGYRRQLRPDDISRWLLVIMEDGVDGIKIIGEADYRAAMRALPTDRYRFIDAVSIVVDGLSNDEIHALAANSGGQV